MEINRAGSAFWYYVTNGRNQVAFWCKFSDVQQASVQTLTYYSCSWGD